MTTPNIEELIDRLRDPQTRGTTGEWFDRAVAADLLQSQAERIKELEAEVEMWKATANAVVDFEKVQLRAEIAAIAATEPVYYEFQWTNPGNQPHQPESMFVWARVEPAWNGTVQQKVDELLAYRYDYKPTYRVRALFTRPMPAQDVEDAERYRWLREQHWSTDTIAVVLNPKQAVKLGYVCPSDSLLDETIDAAIAKGAK